MLRIIFSGEDVAHTRVAPAADPVWELVLSLHLLQGGGADPALSGWRRRVAATLHRDGLAEQMRLLLALNPPRGYFPDFLTPYDSVAGLGAGLEAIRSTPTRLLHRDLGILAADNALPREATALARGEADTVRHLTSSMERYLDLALGPVWDRVQAAVESDRARRARALLDGGADGLLASLRPTIRWDGSVLDIPNYPADRELELQGRGLLLVPSFFCARTPVALLDPNLPPVLVYPAERLGRPQPSGAALAERAAGTGRDALGALLGRTRANVLEVAADGCSTGEIARRLRISPAAASQHTTVLRNAGLLVSHRHRNTVLHTLTPLGRAMLNGG
ncbi:MAG TPA: transcriptional regulator [Micromonosporaceae bacterium]|jgi:DNA-binding transcriptional ArsR family regulator